MSFGFGISDFICCGQLAYQLYTEFQNAAGDCQAFAKELLLLHQIILRTEALIRPASYVIDEADRATLGLCLDMCKDILFVQIAGGDSASWDEKMNYGQRLVLGSHGGPNISMNWHDPSWRNWIRSVRRKFEERNFAKKIPRIRAAISKVIEKLTSFQVLRMR